MLFYLFLKKAETALFVGISGFIGFLPQKENTPIKKTFLVPQPLFSLSQKSKAYQIKVFIFEMGL
ncbi:hypothetical protein [Enterococcus sp. AZ163]|uniref:hypothetical protein n=1 Tax=Enterococcus sp. AZ163 TaxID=2774638 RepID=UPI003D2CA809